MEQNITLVPIPSQKVVGSDGRVSVVWDMDVLYRLKENHPDRVYKPLLF